MIFPTVYVSFKNSNSKSTLPRITTGSLYHLDISLGTHLNWICRALHWASDGAETADGADVTAGAAIPPEMFQTRARVISNKYLILLSSVLSTIQDQKKIYINTALSTLYALHQVQ